MEIKRYKIEEASSKDIKSVDDIHWDKSDQRVKKELISYLNKKGMSRAAELLNKFKPDFVKYYADCAGKNALGDPKNNLFLTYLQNANAGNVVDNRNNFLRVYNTLLAFNKDANAFE